MKSDLIEILQHSLGLDRYGHGRRSRNHFVTGPECTCRDWQLCNELVRLGFMEDHGPQKLADGMHCFTVTQDGINAVALESPRPPKLTRSQRRYREFIQVGDLYESFHQYLITPRITNRELI